MQVSEKLPYSWLIYLFYLSSCYDLAALCGNEFETYPRRANTGSLILLLLIVCSATLTEADVSNYSAKVRLLASVWVHERVHMGQTMNQVMTAFQQRRETLLSWRSANFDAGMRNILIGTVDQCPEQWGVLLLSFLLKTHQTNPQGNYQRNLEYRVRPCLAKKLLMMFGRLIFENEISVTKRVLCCWNYFRQYTWWYEKCHPKSHYLSELPVVLHTLTCIMLCQSWPSGRSCNKVWFQQDGTAAAARSPLLLVCKWIRQRRISRQVDCSRYCNTPLASVMVSTHSRLDYTWLQPVGIIQNKVAERR